MKRWSVFVVLVAVTLVLLIAGELLTPAEREGVQGVRLTTRTPTVTRTAGWWAEVATWTPTPTGKATPEKGAEGEGAATPTPELNFAPVKTLVPPTKDGGQP